MPQTVQLDKPDSQDIAKLTDSEASDLGPSALIQAILISKASSSSAESTSGLALEPPATIDASLDLDTAGTSAKRSAEDDPEYPVNKRVKASPGPSIPTPITIPTPHLSHSYLLDTPTSQTPRLMSGAWPTASPMDDIITTPYRLDPRDTPAIPVEAIGTLQQASSDMLQALVRKDAVDREKQLMVAVGTIRTCLDVHFVPYLEVWRDEAKGDQKGSQVLSFKGKDKQLPIITSGPPPGTPTGPRDLEAASDSVRDTLQNQLAIARATVQRQEQIIKDKDNQLARSREENNRLTTHLAKAKVQASMPIKTIKPIQHPKPDLSNAVSALNKVIDEQNGKIDRQKKYIAELEGRNAKLQKTVVPLPPKPVVNKVDPQVASLKRTINEQAGRIDRQKGQLSNLERQNAMLKKQANVQPSQGGSRRKGQMDGNHGESKVGIQGGTQRDMKPRLGDRIGDIGGHPNQRQIPPHLGGNGGQAESIATNDVDPAFLKSVESLITSLGNVDKREDHVAGPNTAAASGVDTDIPPRSRTGSNRIAVKGRSLWDRIGLQGAEVGEEIGPDMNEVKQEIEQEDGVPSTSLGENEGNLTKADGLGPIHPVEGGWGFPTPVEGGGGNVELRNTVYAHLVPGKNGSDGAHNQGDQWGEDDGEHWDPYHAQSVRAEPGPAPTEW